MKKNLIFAFILLNILPLPLFSQWNLNLKHDKPNALLPSNLIMEYRVLLYDSLQAKQNGAYLYTLHKNITSKPIQEIIIDKVLSGNIQVYDPEFYPSADDSSRFYYKPDYYPYDLFEKNQVLPIDKMKSNLGEGYDSIFVLNENDEYSKKVIKKELDIKEIKSIFFIEDWYFDEMNFTFQKTVIGVSPVRHYMKGDIEEEEVYKRVFDIHYDKKSNEQNFIKTTEIEYEFNLINNDIPIETIFENNYTEKEGCPYWNHISWFKLIDIIYNKVLTGASKAYDYKNGSVYSTDEIKSKIGCKKDTLEIEDWSTGEIIKKVVDFKGDVSDILSVIFIEDWYINEKTLEIKKVVKGIAPVKYYRTYSGDTEDYYDIVRDVLFVIYFDKAFEPK